MSDLYRVLLLDDNRASNYIHAKYLHKASEEIEVVDFQSGKSALNYLRDIRNPLPDALFVDINMPTMNAYEFFDKLSEIGRPEIFDKRIFLLTTSASKFDLDHAKQYRFLELILRKPLDLVKIQDLQLIG